MNDISNRTGISIGVLRGGPSNEYDVSLMTGSTILRHMADKYKVHDILIDKQGVWHRDGVPRTPREALHHIDVVVNAMHGEFGEDGKVQQILDLLGVPYTGSGALGSALAMNKALAKETYKQHGLKIALHEVVRSGEDIPAVAKRLFNNYPLPLVVKPNSAGSSVGVTIARDYASLVAGIKLALTYGDTVIVEQYLRGREATSGVIENFRGEDVYPLLPIEIIPPDKNFFSREVKYNGQTKEISPGNFDKKTTEILQNMAVVAHKALGLRHYSRSDFIVTPQGVYILETNSLPGLTNESLLPKSLVSVGSSLPQFLDHLVTLARTDR